MKQQVNIKDAAEAIIKLSKAITVEGYKVEPEVLLCLIGETLTVNDKQSIEKRLKTKPKSYTKIMRDGHNIS